MSEPHSPAGEPTTSPADRPREPLAQIRRRPNIPAFLITGAGLGAILGVLYAGTTDNGDYSDTAGTAYCAIIFGILGLLLGALAAIYLDHRADNR